MSMAAAATATTSCGVAQGARRHALVEDDEEGQILEESYAVRFRRR